MFCDRQSVKTDNQAKIVCSKRRRLNHKTFQVFKSFCHDFGIYDTHLQVLHISYWYPASSNSGRHRTTDSRTVGGSIHLSKPGCS